MRVLRRMLRDARRTPSSRNARDSLDILVRQVRAHEAEFRFVARERYGGSRRCGARSRPNCACSSAKLTIDLGRMPALGDWDAPDLEMPQT